ncbi:hypothetical protein [Rheinheimera sp. 1928-s]|uniref:hypothetical protein n=1 Tax=Rheinheimera sp. 1928-s TaxID=3033803 RepID=UPI00263206BA|nr:hypothetical protein [Rheinheimera sp. 1928-s]MDF3126421.1 hypothetical protein [Rheinheimera sp. 1928-s]
MKDLFLLKNELHKSLFEDVNSALAEKNQAYLQKFGEVGSLKWWEHYSKGEIESFVVSGDVLSVWSERNEENRLVHYAEIETDKAVLEIEQTEFITAGLIAVGQYYEQELVTIYVDEDDPESSYQFLIRVSVNS